MAPKNNRGKAKGEKKKKEEKVLPVVLDITVNLPDETCVVLKGISTDRIIDVRQLLRVNPKTCYTTNYSLFHQVRGKRVNDTVDVSALKPCNLTLIEDDYEEESAVAHVRRVLDIVACTTCFGQSGAAKDQPKPDASKNASAEQDKSVGGKKSIGQERNKSPEKCSPKEVPADVDGEMSYTYPKLANFYEFFSLSHLTPPLHFIKKVAKRQVEEISAEDHLFSLDVKVCNGKLVHVEACRKGFYSNGKHRIMCHNLVDLLRQLSRAFDNAFSDLMKAFSERNKFGNLPYGFRANTWLVPPVAAQSPSIFPPLPVEDETWGGNGGGLGRDGKGDLISWANEFSFLASMPCKTADERQVRDRKAFLLHSLFVDVAIFRAIEAVKHVMAKPDSELTLENGELLYTERVGDLRITVMKDASDASYKVDTKIDGILAIGGDEKKLVERNLLKGITADENTTAHDISTLGVMNVRYCGYVAVVKVEGGENKNDGPSSQSIELEQPEGGANALNINSLRLLLHKTSTSEQNKLALHLQSLEYEELNASLSFVKGLVEESLTKLEKEELKCKSFVRWELGACWIQHLQDQKNTEKDKKPSGEKAKNEMKVEGLGKPLRSIKSNKKKTDVCTLKIETGNSSSHSHGVNGEVENVTSASIGSQLEDNAKDNELALQRMLSNEAFARLKESGTGLHRNSLQELIDLSQKYYSEVALPKLVADFGSLELSPVDGRTLTDFMHTRGLQMRSMGHVVKLSEKLSHVQSLCIKEMIVRAFKHILRAVIASVGNSNTEKMAVSIAAALNLMLGVPENRELHKSCKIHSLIWRWLEVFLMKRFEWDINNLDYKDVKKFTILRGLCHKVGIELVPRDFDMDSPRPFRKSDVVSLVPVHKQAACSSADGRQLLESSKTALDKGKLEDAVTYGTKALAKLVAVCGPYNRMTAGAYSLLAVVLYHTGDFNQATIYQQKALNINERELGLDHPDTMKSYGDLAVFYYRLQHTELALKYVNRALYLLHLTCGPSHPNTAATYINVAMMEEGMGNVHIALRYLHKALKCNQKLLGPDHIQTAASYHAIAIALSLMEAYPLSVQHEQTTLKILRAKLGPDDLRTQDAAAWLEYFESKAFEQQEATRNGTRKPDASIASKGHLSVSDLLDYINPTHNAKEKDVMNIKRRSHVTKVKLKPDQTSSSASSDESPVVAAKEASDEEIHLSNQEGDADATQETSSLPVESLSPECEETTERKLNIANETLAESSAEGDDGWQPVQRPRSTSSLVRRLKQRRGTVTKVYNYQKKNVTADVDVTTAKALNQNGRYYVLKKRTLSHGAHTDQHTMNPPRGSKYGRRLVKTVTYRVKSMPSSKTVSTETSRPADEVFVSQVEGSLTVPPTFQGRKSPIVSLGKSPSYKEVALAPPGSIAKSKFTESQSDPPNNQELWVENHQEVDGNEMKENSDTVGMGTENLCQERKEVVTLDSKDDFDKGTGFAEGKEDTGSTNGIESKSSLMASESEEKIKSSEFEVEEVQQDSKLIIGVQDSIDSPKKELLGKENSESFEPHSDSNTALQEEVDLKVDSGESRGLANKKLSASAAPFNPLTTVAHSPPVTMNIALPLVPAVAPWPVNMPLHPSPTTVLLNPMCSSPHHPYPSPPLTPNTMQSLPFMYPPYTHTQPIQTSSSYHTNQFSWQYNMNPNVSEFIPGTVWSGCRPMEFSVPPPVVEPIAEPILEPKMKHDISPNHSSAQTLPVEVDTVGKTKKEVYLPAPETINIVNEEEAGVGQDSLKENGHSNKFGVGASGNGPVQHSIPNGNAGCSTERKNDGEKTFSILMRGRRNRKQTLRMPISLLNRPYGSKSFKVIYNRVMRGSEAPKVTSFSSSEDCTTSTT
ncbi:hypothetical protein SLA2020_486330 [Shorea laevis]